MSFDQVTWAPRRGDTGDDQYDVADDCGIAAGDAGAFSATPTIEEIEASSGLNQVVALANRRLLQFKTRFGGTALTALPYFTSETRYARTAWNNLETRIKSIRTLEGFDNTGLFATAHAAGDRIARTHILALRKALRISGTLIRLGWCDGGGVGAGDKGAPYVRRDWPYGTIILEYWQTGGILTPAGQAYAGPSFRYQRRRGLWSCPMPDWVANLVSATASVYSAPSYSPSGHTYTMWRSDTDDSAYSDFSGAGHFDNAIVSFVTGTNPGTFIDATVPNADIEARAGTRVSWILAEERERSGIPPTSGADEYAQYTSGKPMKLTLDFGS